MPSKTDSLGHPMGASRRGRGRETPHTPISKF
ncbi:hypothetical protein IODZLFCR_CDS0003 [Salmonella phage vB_SalP_SE29]|uniref:Uncharacterized protein n=1 Tax=Salmonella phage vB_SalP_SE29 TaxID=3134913 RepID=A0AAX4LXG0_9CAUD